MTISKIRPTATMSFPAVDVVRARHGKLWRVNSPYWPEPRFLRLAITKAAVDGETVDVVGVLTKFGTLPLAETMEEKVVSIAGEPWTEWLGASWYPCTPDGDTEVLVNRVVELEQSLQRQGDEAARARMQDRQRLATESAEAIAEAYERGRADERKRCSAMYEEVNHPDRKAALYALERDRERAAIAQGLEALAGDARATANAALSEHVSHAEVSARHAVADGIALAAQRVKDGEWSAQQKQNEDDTK